MSDIIRKLNATLTDGDNMPRMKQEKWLPVALAEEAAAELSRLKARVEELEREAATDKADAERWRAFFSSERFYVMGWTGFTTDAEKPEVNPKRDPRNWLHFTLNIWDKYPSNGRDDRQGRHGRAMLLAYVEHLRAAALALKEA
jgi:hypothetical protein